MRSTAAFTLDAAVCGLLLAVVAIIATGGGVYHVAGIRVSARTTTNPLLIALALSLLRVSLSSRPPFFWSARARPASIWAWTTGPLDWLASLRLPARAPALTRTVIALCLGITVVKLALAWTHHGFFSGDDVEVHEMSLGVLLEQHWPTWSLRNAFYPLGVVYPAQWAARALGITDTALLIYAGRAIVCLVSTLSILLTWRVGRRLWGAAAGYALIATVLVAFSSVLVAFGSTELPRPVATVLLALAFRALLESSTRSSAAAGALVGIAAAFRYSEVTFLAAGVIHLAWERNWRRMLAFGIGGAATAALAIGIADALYWGSPFYSLQQAVHYTLVDRLSSRGYQSIAWYATHVTEWSAWPVILLAVLGTSRAPRAVAVWAWLPILMLSLLPHKEARYVVPSVPFVCLLAAFGVQAVVESGRRFFSVPADRLRALIVPALVFAILQEAGGWRLRRTDADVVLFRTVVGPQLAPDAVLAAEQAWRIGGRLYQPPGVRLIDLDPGALSADTLPQADWILLDEGTVNRLHLREALGSAGYVEVDGTEASRYRVFRQP